MSDVRRPVVFVIPGDLHLTELELENYRVAQWVVDQVNDLIHPDFVQFIGDNVQHATPAQFKLFRELCSQLKVPHFALVGDHDVHRDPQADNFRELVGETYGSHAVNGFRFVRLNTQEAKPVGISPQQLNWLSDQLSAAKAAGERVLVMQHNYPFQIWESFEGPGIEEWRELLAGRVTAVFTGHTHYWQVANDGRNVFVACRSIGDPEGGSPGYVLGYVDQDDLAVTFRSIAELGPIVLITHPRDVLLATTSAHIVSGPDQWRVRVWSQRPIASVQLHIGQGGWTELTRSAGELWTRDLIVDELPKGESWCEARAIDEAGFEGRSAITIHVDTTGRFTAVPKARPDVKSTAFC